MRNKLLSLQTDFYEMEKGNQDLADIGISGRIGKLLECKSYIDANTLLGGNGNISINGSLFSGIANLLSRSYLNLSLEDDLAKLKIIRSKLYQLGFLAKKYSFNLMLENFKGFKGPVPELEIEKHFNKINMCDLRPQLIEDKYFDTLKRVCKKNNILVCEKGLIYLGIKKALDEKDVKSESFLKSIDNFNEAFTAFTNSLFKLYANHFQTIYKSKEVVLLTCMESFMDQQVQIKLSLMRSRSEIITIKGINQELILNPSVSLERRIVGGRFTCRKQFIK